VCSSDLIWLYLCPFAYHQVVLLVQSVRNLRISSRSGVSLKQFVVHYRVYLQHLVHTKN